MGNAGISGLCFIRGGGGGVGGKGACLGVSVRMGIPGGVCWGRRPAEMGQERERGGFGPPGVGVHVEQVPEEVGAPWGRTGE